MRTKEDWVAIFIITLIAFGVFGLIGKAHAEPDYQALADAIYKAEGGAKAVHQYGIMTKYKVTTPRQACINTCRHAFKDYSLQAQKPTKEGFIAFLGARYCPTTGDRLRPSEKALNRNWVPNVNRLYKGGI